MKNFLLIIYLILSSTFGALANNSNILDSLRTYYLTVVTNKESCIKWMESAEKLQESNPIFKAYLGYIQTVRANHVINPINKLKTFNEGKSNIEKAIKLDSNCVEIRFLRLSVQKNAPNFLNYNQHIQADMQYIKKYKHLITSKLLLDNIQLLVKQ